MEDRFPRPEDGSHEEAETTPKRRRGGDFLSQYLSRLRRKEQGSENHETDDEEESDEKPKKFRRFFRGIFKSMVETPESSKEEKRPVPSLESLFFGWQEHEDGRENPKTSTEELVTERAQSSEENTDTKPVAEAKTSSPVTEIPEATNPEQARPSNEDIPTQEVVMPVIDRIKSQPKVGTESQGLDRNRTFFERTHPESVTEREVAVERGVGAALPVALVAAEYIGRKRADRRIERQTTKKIDRLEKENQQESYARAELTNLVRQNKEQLEALKRERGIGAVERSALPQMHPERTEASRGVEVRNAPERTNTPHNETVIERPSAERPIERAPEKTTTTETYKIMEQVASAAEHDVPVEIVFERSHEVKDDQSIPSTAASVAAIMAAQAEEKRRIAQTQALQRQMGDGNQSLPTAHDTGASAGMYRQAMQNGFWTAIVIIIIGVAAYLLQ